MFDGNDDDVGVAGSTLTLLCGDFVCLCPETETEGDPMDIEDVEDAFECEWWWCGIERMEDTDEEVDFLPRRPPEERRYEERGVSGAGLAERRRALPEPLVDTRGRGGSCVADRLLVCE
jgi:hypothetical protein